MTIEIDAVFQDGVLKPKVPLSLNDGTEVRLTIRAANGPRDPLAAVIGICDSGRDDGAARHDEYLYRKPRP